MRRLPIIVSIFFVIITLAGCQPTPTLSDSEAHIYRQLHQKFSRMDSYSATVKLTVRSNKTESIYTMTQKVKSPDQAVVTLKEPEALAGVTTVFSGDFVSVSAFPEEAALTVPAQNVVNDLLINEFFSLYYKSEDTVLSVSTSSENQGTILLETVAIPDSSTRYKISLLCDAKKLEPKTMTVYDVGGNVRMIAEFSDFSYNPILDSGLFTIH